MRRKNNESGAILAIVIIFMFAVTITGLAFLSSTVMEHNLAMREVHKTQAFYLAEGGVEDARFKLGQDWNLVPDYDPIDGPKDSSLPEATLGEGVYNVTIYNTEPDGGTGLSSDRRRVHSTGTVKEIFQIVQVIVRQPPSVANIKSALESGGNVKVTGDASIISQSPDILAIISKTEPVVAGSGEVIGGTLVLDPSNFETGGPEGYDDYFQEIFRVTREEMKQMAQTSPNAYYDHYIQDDKELDANYITWIEAPGEQSQITSKPWSGEGILIVNGDLKMTGGTFEGIIWVTGSFTIPKGNPVIKGAVFVEGEIDVDIVDVVGGTVNLEYDATAIDIGLGKIATLPWIEPGTWEQLK